MGTLMEAYLKKTKIIIEREGHKLYMLSKKGKNSLKSATPPCERKIHCRKVPLLALLIQRSHFTSFLNTATIRQSL